MKLKIFCTIFGLVLVVISLAQKKELLKIAPFKIILTNGQSFQYTQLKKNEPVVLVYFSPDCDHCKEFAKHLIANYAIVQNKQVVMITYLPLPEVQQFDQQFKLSGHKNIKIGTEGFSFTVQAYYNVQHFPFLALYDKNGNQKVQFKEEVPFEKIKAAIVKL
jgi:thiol-disulfide isomerase/thioredoxin